MRRLIVLLSASLVAVTALSYPARGQQQQGEKAPQVTSAVRNDVLAFVRGYLDAENRADATALSDAISRREDVTSINSGNITRGWAAIRDATDLITGKQGSFRLDAGSMDVVSLGAGYVLVLSPTTLTVNTQRGVQQIGGAMTLVLEKSKDGWKILNEHYSLKPQ
jgi:ketosteroid isomerase-like protein